MANHLKALPAHGESTAASPLDPATLGSAPPGSAPLNPLDFDGTRPLSDTALRVVACESPVPGARLAAAWRLMMRGQALPAGAPGEGLRILTLLNLATQQDLEILEVLVCLDPAPSVRAQAAVLLWRVARDRDRVVDRLVAQIEAESATDVLIQLLSLAPALPFEKTRSVVRPHLHHPSLEVRRAGWSYWLDSGGPLEPTMTASIWREPSRELRAWCFLRWASDPSHADMLRDVAKYPGATAAVFEALSLAGRSFRLSEMAAHFDHHLDGVLRLARRPFDVADRRILVSLTGLIPVERRGDDGRPVQGRSRLGWTGDALQRCVHEACSSPDTPPPTDEEKTWIPVIEARIAALEAEGAAAEASADDDDYEHEQELADLADDLEDLRRLLRWLTR